MKVMAMAWEGNELRAGDTILHNRLMFPSCDRIFLAPQDERRRGNVLQQRRRIIGELFVINRMPDS